MMQRLTTQVPVWMRPDHPILRYALGNPKREISTRARFTRRFAFIALVALLILSGYLIANAVLDENPLDQPVSEMLINVLFWPAFVLQVILQVIVMAMTINTVGDEKRRQTWESLKTTVSGASLALRARWSAVVFYRVGGLLSVLVLVRLVLVGGVLFDLTAFRGEYLNYLTGSIEPDVPLAAGIVLLALTMTASLLLPFTGVAFDASVGLLVSTLVQQRTYVVLAQIALTAVRVLIVGALLIGVTQFREGTLTPDATELGIWMLLFGFAVIGDWGLSLLYLGYYGAEVWAEVPYGILIGVAMLGFVVVQAALTDLIMSLAIRRAERSE